MKEIRIPHIRQVNITRLQNGNRAASVACCGGWAKRSQRSRILSLNIEVELNARTINRLLEYLSCGEHHFNLEIHSKAEVGKTMVKLFLNCRTENIECKFGPPPAAGSDTVRYCFKIRTEPDAFRTNGEPLGAGGKKKEPKAGNSRCSTSVFRPSRTRNVSARQ